MRSVQACQGAILLVDAAEGPQAQTVAVYNLAKNNNLKIIPVLNKIDLPRANCAKVKEQLQKLFKIDPADILEISAKKGWCIKEVVQALIERIPPPPVCRDGFLKGLVFDTWHDKYRGVLCVTYIQNGTVNVGDSVKWLSFNKQQKVKYISILKPEEQPVKRAEAGQVALIGCGPRNGGAVGDILLSDNAPIAEFHMEANEVRHMVYAGIFPEDPAQYGNVEEAINKLSLNDSAASIAIDMRFIILL